MEDCSSVSKNLFFQISSAKNFTESNHTLQDDMIGGIVRYPGTPLALEITNDEQLG